jgi:hypothetical protein
MWIADLLLLTAPVLAASSGQSSGVSWRDLLAIVAIILPLVFGLILYLVKSKSDKEAEALKETIQRLERTLEKLQDKQEAFEKEVYARYLTLDGYQRDLEAQKEHLGTIKELIQQQVDKVEDLIKLFSS